MLECTIPRNCKKVILMTVLGFRGALFTSRQKFRLYSPTGQRACIFKAPRPAYAEGGRAVYIPR